MTKILNIDALAAKTPLIVTLAGVEHKMKAPTLNDFIANMKALTQVQSTDVVAEAEMMIDMIARSFPTLDSNTIREWPVTAVEQLFEAIRSVDSASVEDTNGGDEGNAQSAS